MYQKIDWQKQKRALIQRVFEHGNKEEKHEITPFDTQDTIDIILNNN